MILRSANPMRRGSARVRDELWVHHRRLITRAEPMRPETRAIATTWIVRIAVVCVCLLGVAQSTRPLQSLEGPQSLYSSKHRSLFRHTIEEVSSRDPGLFVVQTAPVASMLHERIRLALIGPQPIPRESLLDMPGSIVRRFLFYRTDKDPAPA